MQGPPVLIKGADDQTLSLNLFSIQTLQSRYMGGGGLTYSTVFTRVFISFIMYHEMQYTNFTTVLDFGNALIRKMR